MRKIIILAFTLVFSGFLMAQEEKTVVFDKNVQPRSASGFNAIQVSSAIDLYLSQGKEDAVAVSAGSDEIRDQIKTVVSNGVLKIYFDGKSIRNWSNTKMKAYVTFKSLQRIEASGACNVRLVDPLQGESLIIELSGASDFRGKVTLANLVVESSGASNMTLEGRAQTAKFDLSGASSVKAFDLEIAKCKALASGASVLRMFVQEELSVQASGASSVQYKGNCVVKDINATGGSSIKQQNNYSILKPFKITIENNGDRIKMYSSQGSAWVDLSFPIEGNKEQAINQFGMTELNESISNKDTKFANYLFVISRTKDGVKLRGLEGTAWKELSFILPLNAKQAIDHFGMIK